MSDDFGDSDFGVDYGSEFGGNVDFGASTGDFSGGDDGQAGISSPFGDGLSTPFSQRTLADVTQKARQLALASIRPRLAQFQEGITGLTRLANASPQALTQQLAPQIEQARAALKQMFQQSSQRFGQFGGGQAQREQARGAEAIGGQITRLFGGMPEQARNALLSLIESFQITPQPAAPVTNVSSQPFNAAAMLGALQSGAAIGQTGRGIYDWWNTPTATPGYQSQGMFPQTYGIYGAPTYDLRSYGSGIDTGAIPDF